MMVAFAFACLSAQAQYPATSDVLEFQNRKIDVAPFFDGFPFSQFRLSDDGSKLFFLKSGAEARMQWIELDGKQSPFDGKDAIDADLSKRNGWNPAYNASDKKVYWLGDEHNEERFNIYRCDLNNPGKLERITDVPYVYEWGFNQDKTKIAYVGRMGQNENRLDELHVLDLKTMKDQLIGIDNPDYRYTWGSISWRPDGSGLLLTALKNMDRRFCTVAYVDLATNKITPLNDPEKNASFDGCDMMKEWVNNDECYYFSDQDGYRNLYLFNAKTKATKQITSYKEPLEDARLVRIGKKNYIFGLQSTPIQTSMILIDPVNNKEVYRNVSDQNYTIGSVKDNVVRVVANNVTTLMKVEDLVVGKKNVVRKTVLGMPENIQKELVQSDVERLAIPTFDIDPATGKTRMIHAYLFKPKNPLPADKSVVMIQSFYGGTNSYDSEYQIYNKAGISVLSPAPRGSAGFGRDFAALNDGDLGGNEILDIIKCAQYISGKLNIPAERVGCFGVSHGGYATMRLMTFPGKINGTEAKFSFGFGVETAGFCDIIYQHYHSNIPDWTFLEAGDPVANHDKLIDRSPLYHAEKLTGPLLLCHGNHDNRVDIEGSKLMDRMLTHLGLPHRYVEFEGLGHGVKGKEPLKLFYRNVFRFLDEIESGNGKNIK